MFFNEAEIRRKIALMEVEERIYKLTTDKKGMPNVQFISGEFKRYIHSSYDAVRDGRKFAAANYTDNGDLAVFGLGLGYHIKAFIELLKPGQKLYVFETNLVLLKIALENTDIADYMQQENVNLYAGESFNAILKQFIECPYRECLIVSYYQPALETVPEDFYEIERYMKICRIKLREVPEMICIEDSVNYFRHKPKANHKYKIILLDCRQYHSAYSAFSKNIMLAFRNLNCEIRFMKYEEYANILCSEAHTPDWNYVVSCDFVITLHLSYTFGCPPHPLFDIINMPVISIGFDQPYSFPLCLDNTLKNVIYTWPDRNTLQRANFYIKTGAHCFLPQCAEIDYDPDRVFNKERFLDVVIYSGYHFSKIMRGEVPCSEDFDKELVLRVYDYYKEHCTRRRLEDCVRDVLGLSRDDETLLRFMRDIGFGIDLAMRSYKKYSTLKALLDEGINVHLFGYEWDNGKTDDIVNHPRCIYHKGAPYESMQEIFEYSKIFVNIMPSYNMDGTHEKIYSSMSHGALCITDAADYLRETFTEDEDIIFYDNDDIKGLAEKIRFYLANEDERLRVSKNASANVRENHTWINRAESIIGFYEDFMRSKEQYQK